MTKTTTLTLETLIATAGAAVEGYPRRVAVADAIGTRTAEAAALIDPLTDDPGRTAADVTIPRSVITALIDGRDLACTRMAEKTEHDRLKAGGIPQHRAVKAAGPARLNERIKFRGGRTGVVLQSRDTNIIGYPIPLRDGRYLVAAKFGAHRYHEDAPPMYLALGRIVRSEKAARKALDAHGPTLRAALEMEHLTDGSPAADGVLPRDTAAIAGTGPHAADYARHTWHADSTGRLVESWSEYDFGPRVRRSLAPVPTARAALIVGVPETAIEAARAEAARRSPEDGGDR